MNIKYDRNFAVAPRGATALLIGALFCVGVLPAHAQDGVTTKNGPTAEKAGRVIEEVLVTAQKREEVSQKVPISMSVMDENFIVEQSITDLKQALDFTPNFSYESFSGGWISTPRCRGFGVDARNSTFEPPCGVAIDGVAFTRDLWFAASLFDVKRLEVLRGPQGTTFGKNTTAGVISVITKDASDEFTGDVNLQYGERDLQRIEVGLGGPIIPGFLNFRIAGMTEEQDGYVKNTLAEIADVQKWGGATDRDAFRIKLDFPDLQGSRLKFSYETADIANLGNTAELSDANLTQQQYYLQFDPNMDFEKGNYRNSSAYRFGSVTEIERTQLDWNYTIGEWDIDLVLSAGKADSENFGGASIAPVAYGTNGRVQENSTDTFELRTLSPRFPGLFGLGSGESDFLVGAFYQKQTVDGFLRQLAPEYTFLSAQVLASLGVVRPPYENSPLGMTGVPEPTGGLRGVFDQEEKASAVFAEFKWYLTEQWLLQLGARYSKERKDGSFELILDDGPNTLFTRAGSSNFQTTQDFDDDFIQPKFTIGYSPTEDINVFVHWARAVKGGGFNSLRVRDPNLVEQNRGERPKDSFDRETVTEWGADLKMMLLDGAMRLNISVFRMDLEDFQVLTMVPPARTDEGVEIPLTQYNEVVNAPEARAQGVEADLLWLATDWLTLIGTVGYNDTEYLDFPINACPSDQPNQDGDAEPRCDASGKAFQRAPKWNNTLTATVKLPMSALFDSLDGVDFIAGTTVEYVSSQFEDAALDRRLKQDSYFRWRANIGLENKEQGWSFRVIGENLADEVIYQSSFGNFGGRGVDYFPQEPRTIYGQLTWTF